MAGVSALTAAPNDVDVSSATAVSSVPALAGVPAVVSVPAVA